MVGFGLTYDMRCPDFAPAPADAYYRTALEQCQWAERRGFSAVNFNEHHGSEDGYLPSPVGLATAVAGCTTSLRVRPVIQAPFYNPIRLAEDLAVLDQVSGGRLTPILIAGYRPEEFKQFDTDVRDRRRLTDQMAEFLKLAWTGSPFDYGDREIRVTPRPCQVPRPPIGMGGSSRIAARSAARVADEFHPNEQRWWEPYRDERLLLGHEDPGPVVARGPSFLFVTKDPERAWTDVAPHVLHLVRSYADWTRAAYGRTLQQLPDAASEADLRRLDAYQVVTPEQCVDLVRALGDPAFVRLQPLYGGVPPELSWTSLELFADEVIPALNQPGQTG
jgi:alkanesulfonate monooxygenase SsuD/methylene tetrahydromethanopterin reductase-like flavin-dependent oxidoreductase (luciferase family)